MEIYRKMYFKIENLNFQKHFDFSINLVSNDVFINYLIKRILNELFQFEPSFKLRVLTHI